jgi:hypothetical protein
MITKHVIQSLYKKYRKAPESPDCLDMQLLYDSAQENHKISVDIDNYTLTIGSLEPSSPFRTIPLNNIHAIVPFEEWIAIVLHSSIIFLNRKSSKVSVHIRPHSTSLWHRILEFFGKM